MAHPRQQVFERWQKVTVQASVLGLIDLLCHMYKPACVVDLGARGQGRGRIDGAYLRYCQSKTACRGIAVDRDGEGMDQQTLGFDFVGGDINCDAVRSTVMDLGPPDTAFLFNVLLHQLSWEQTLQNWSQLECLCIFGPRWTGDRSVRLLDNGKEWFDQQILKKLVGANYEATKTLLDSERAYEHIELWQWGISGEDLNSKLRSLDYNIVAHLVLGPYNGLEHFEVQAHIALKST